MTDILDGQIARKYNVCSVLGGHLDIFADFTSISSVLIVFSIKEVYPFWVLVIVLVMFVQFLFTSRSKELLYDPIGKYYGTFLFAMLVITLYDLEHFMTPYILLGFITFTALSICSRIFALLKKRTKN